MFRGIVKHLKGWLNIIIPAVDFDSVGTAVGLSNLVYLLGHKQVQTFYAGPFTLRQKDWLDQHYKLERWLKPISCFRPDNYQGEQHHYALVDSSMVKDDRLGCFKDCLDPIIVIDHHNGFTMPNKRIRFVYIDTSVGAASTLMTELFVKLQAFSRLSVNRRNLVALLMAMGIYTDTMDFSAVEPRDRVAYDFLRSQLDEPDHLDFLQEYPWPDRHEQYYQSAQQHLLLTGDCLVTSVGLIKRDDVIALARVADDLFQQHQVRMVVVGGLYRNACQQPVVRFSVRMDKCTDLNGFISFTQSLISQGAGGRRTQNGIAMGGGQVSLSELGVTNQADPNPIVVRHISDRIKSLPRPA